VLQSGHVLQTCTPSEARSTSSNKTAKGRGGETHACTDRARPLCSKSANMLLVCQGLPCVACMHAAPAVAKSCVQNCWWPSK